jgi:cytoskeletal protein CcmA (bactofilin family)/ribosomal protein L37AE/L43A
MSDTLRKAPFRCPLCGFVQLESASLFSTYCRSCGNHYTVAPEGKTPAQAKSGSLVTRAVKKIVSRPPREVKCHHCGTVHEVSGHARTTICPGCTASIELVDVRFDSIASRAIDTRGKLHIGPEGHLNNESIICGEALIEGKLSGRIQCERTLHLACIARIQCRILADEVVVEKSAKVVVTVPIETRSLVVLGSLQASVVCSGKVLVARGGVIDGEVRARAIVVDPGGTFTGRSLIDSRSGWRG